MYGEAWSPYTPTQEEISSFASSPASWWSYSDEAPLPLGGIAEYPGSGYVATLGDSLEDAADVIAGLRRMSWVDSRTAVVFVEFCVFNANLNLFTTVTMATRFASDDDDLPSHRVRVFAIPPALSSWLPACVLLVLLTLVKAARQLFHSLNRDGLAGLRCPVLWLEAAACALRLQLVAAHFQWVDAANRAISTIATGTGVFTSFQEVAFYVELLRFSTATLVFLALLRVLTIAGATVTLACLGRALAVRVRRLRGFGAICASVACGSSFLMWALLGHRLYQFRRFIGSAGVVVAAPAIPSARDLGRIAGAPMEAAARLALAFVFRLLMPMCAFVVAGGGVPWAGEAGSSEAVGASDVREYLGSVVTSGKAAAVKFVTACKGRMGRRGFSDSVPFPTGGSEPDRCGAIRARVVFPLDIYHAEPEPNHATLASRDI
ncbi:polycystin-2-like protein 1 [Lethenteron reissneri]|uniref:polycystin-2-like protein 1 n=1 Tax=Lethenteron reissneri TaxID=7753 RepID=UPI002AB765E7|nr:polycystin-2-like protein 1 [Lethenteron reissneri]